MQRVEFRHDKKEMPTEADAAASSARPLAPEDADATQSRGRARRLALWLMAGSSLLMLVLVAVGWLALRSMM